MGPGQALPVLVFASMAPLGLLLGFQLQFETGRCLVQTLLWSACTWLEHRPTVSLESPPVFPGIPARRESKPMAPGEGADGLAATNLHTHAGWCWW